MNTYQEQSQQWTLFHYWRSSCSWRVRWALQLKGLSPKMIPVSLLDGESESLQHGERNPFHYVPVLKINNQYLSESMAIIEFLDEIAPEPHRLFSGDAYERAHIRQLCEYINAGTQPLQNLNILEKVGSDTSLRTQWAQDVIRQGLTAFESMAAPKFNGFSVGSKITAADLFLIPQCYNALRFGINLEQEFSVLNQIYLQARATPHCIAASPESYEPKSN